MVSKTRAKTFRPPPKASSSLRYWRGKKRIATFAPETSSWTNKWFCTGVVHPLPLYQLRRATEGSRELLTRKARCRALEMQNLPILPPASFERHSNSISVAVPWPAAGRQRREPCNDGRLQPGIFLTLFYMFYFLPENQARKIFSIMWRLLLLNCPLIPAPKGNAPLTSQTGHTLILRIAHGDLPRRRVETGNAGARESS